MQVVYLDKSVGTGNLWPFMNPKNSYCATSPRRAVGGLFSLDFFLFKVVRQHTLVGLACSWFLILYTFDQKPKDKQYFRNEANEGTQVRYSFIIWKK